MIAHDRSPWPLRGRLDQRDPRIQAAGLGVEEIKQAAIDHGGVKRVAGGVIVTDWLQLHETMTSLTAGRIETEIGPYGCAFMCALEAGRVLSRVPPNTPMITLARWRMATETGSLGDECYVEDWERLLRLCAPEFLQRGKISYLGRKRPSEVEPSLSVLVIARGHQPQRPRLGGHFWLPKQPLIAEPYDPLGSAEPGLSFTRQRGELLNLRVFRIER